MSRTIQIALTIFWVLKFFHCKKYTTFDENKIARKTFSFHERANSLHQHEIIISIKQKNLTYLETYLKDVSNPDSINFRKWLTKEEIGQLISNPEATQAVTNYLAAEGVEIRWVSTHGEYLRASAPIHAWERILSTIFFRCEDRQFNNNIRHYYRAKEINVPISISNHVTAIFNTIQIPPEIYSSSYRSNSPMSKGKIPPFRSNMLVENGGMSSSSAANTVTVSFLNKLYSIPSNYGSPKITQSVVETADEYFSPKDLTQFQTKYNLPVQAAISKNNHNISDCSNVADSCGEGNLDIQYIMGIAQKTTSIYWYSPYQEEDPFLKWILDISDDPFPPLTNSISWGAVEQSISKSIMEAFNNAAMKLSNLGVTIVVSSGESASSFYCLCNQSSSSSDSPWSGTPWSGKGYFPSFPATSPYVTSVGATMGPEQGRPEVGCQSDAGGVITSGGGFSTYYPQPTWQKAAVDTYFSKLAASQIPSAGFNRKGRGIPDVSLIGVNYEFISAGALTYRFGTSCSAPVFAAMVSLLNSYLFTKNLPTVGFLNPMLYSNKSKSIFNDILVGNNKCCASTGSLSCCKSGFNAAVGWDPMTGWGSVNYTSFRSVFTSAVKLKGTSVPSKKPTLSPSSKSTLIPSTNKLTTRMPSSKLTNSPSCNPTQTVTPSKRPVNAIQSPTRIPTTLPSVKRFPSCVPTRKPTAKPTSKPSSKSTVKAV
mmetsp:Transcript_11069/g.16653  ORF Transcript_11069/g.16653 Transcript_11069/m.16653 type:complete len:709 (-) Transcript_11069:403-2529(-)